MIGVIDHDNRANQTERMSGLIRFGAGPITAAVVIGQALGGASTTGEEQQQA